MKSKEIDVGIYRIKLTVFKTGNVLVCFVNTVSGEERTLRVRNPLNFQKEDSPVGYRV